MGLLPPEPCDPVENKLIKMCFYNKQEEINPNNQSPNPVIDPERELTELTHTKRRCFNKAPLTVGDGGLISFSHPIDAGHFD